MTLPKCTSSQVARVAAQLTFLLSFAGLAAAQNRIAANVSPASPRVSLPNTVSPRARLANDLGEAPPDRQLTSVTLRFNLSGAQSAALDTLLVAQQNPQSPLFHKWLTPEQYGAQFGLSDADLTKIATWLQSQGLTVTGTARSRTFVTVSGTVTQIESAFNTSLHIVSLAGEEHIANLAEPSLPEPIAAVVGSVIGLSDFRLKPRARAHFTSSLSGAHFLAPGDIYTIYDIKPLLTDAINGSGITIAVAGQTDIFPADVAAFRSASGLSANPPTIRLYGADPGFPSAADLTEASLDVEWSGAVAPAASILYVNSTDVLAGSLSNIVDNNLAPIATVSYGNCESSFGSSDIAAFNQLFRQANAQGQTIVGPAGDSGATDCDYLSTAAAGGLAVDFPASSPYVTGVGGTMLNEGGGTYWNTSNGNFGGSARSYIPETIWNESGSGNVLSSGGGGASAYFIKPGWQVGTGVPADSSRDVPDLSFSAASGHDGYLICEQGFCTNGFRDAANDLDVVGGTSVSTPEFAGMMALLEQKIQARVGNANPTIYALANSTYSTNVFHDVTLGSNDSPCTLGTANCTSPAPICNGVANTAPGGGAQGCIGYQAAAGFDLASGWGSLDTFNYVNDWPLVTPLGSGSAGAKMSETSITGSSASVTAGATVLFSVQVASATSGASSNPTGTVQLLVDNVAAGSAVALSPSGGASFTYATTGLASGAHSFTAAYSGDVTYAGSKGVFTLDVVSAATADFSLSPATGTLTTKSGGTTSGLTFTVAPLNGFVGQVSFAATSTSNALAATYSFSVNPVNVTSSASGSTVLTLVADVSNAQGTGLFQADRRARADQIPAGGKRRPGWALPGTGLAVAGLLIFVLPKRRSRWTALLLAVVCAGSLALSGCSTSGTSSRGLNITNTVPGTYTVVVTASGTSAAGTSLSHSATVTFVVQ